MDTYEELLKRVSILEGQVRVLEGGRQPVLKCRCGSRLLHPDYYYCPRCHLPGTLSVKGNCCTECANKNVSAAASPPAQPAA